ncbi:discoidin domain-containing protein, partial [Streptomyces sp. NPDC056728]
GGWLDVDGRAGLVVRGSDHPIAVYGDTILAADGPAAPVVVEGYPGVSAKTLRALARKASPTTGNKAIQVAFTEEHLSLFNLSGDTVTTTVDVPQSGAGRVVFQGDQTLTDSGTSYQAELLSAEALLLPPRFTVTPVSGVGRLPTGLRVQVTDGATVRLSGAACRVRVEGQHRSEVAVVSHGRETTVRLHGVTPFPLDDLALGRTVFPTTPLPAGMSDPAAAVDGDPATAWWPGPDGRMVVDLGARLQVGSVEVDWTVASAPALAVEVSDDGVDYRSAGRVDGRGRDRELTLDTSARYVAVQVDGRLSADTRITRLSVRR